MEVPFALHFVGLKSAQFFSFFSLNPLPENGLLKPPVSSQGLPLWRRNKESATDEQDTGWIRGSGRSPGGGNGSPLQYSCLENPMDRGAWRATVHGVTKSQTRLKHLNNSKLSGAEWRGRQFFF